MTSVNRRFVEAVAILCWVSGISYYPSAAPLKQTSNTADSSIWNGSYTDEQAKRGQAHYLQDCATCHGDALAGSEAAPALAGDVFMEAWDGRSAGDLLEKIQTSMPADSPGRLTKQQYVDIVAFVLKSNGLPAAEHELGRDTALLKEIRLQRSKPQAK